MSNSDAWLLRRYVEQRDDAAFAELVRHNLPLVYRCACRLLNGDAARAEDVAQEVFVHLVRKARSLTGHPALAAWLHTTTRYTVARVRRGEQRRRLRHEEAARMNEIEEAGKTELSWARLQPVIDEALAELKAPDREAVLLRFFAGKSYLEVGRCLGLSEDAARMRVDRAVEKLRVQLVRLGVGSTAAALGMSLAGQGALAVPAGLAVSVTQGALAAGTLGATGAVGSLIAWLGTGSGKLAALGVLAGAAGVGGVYLASRNHGPAEQGTQASLATGTLAGSNPGSAVEPWSVLLAAWDQASGSARTRLLLAVPAHELGRRLLLLWRENTSASRARFQALFDHWCVVAPEPAAKWSVTTWDEITGEEGAKLREQAGLAWVTQAMKPAYAWALTLRDAASEAGLAARMLGQLARTRPREAIVLAKERSVVFYETTRFLILEGWSELDPADAFATLGDECIHHKRMPDLLGKWPGADVKGFMFWGFEGTLLMSEQDSADRDRKRLRAAASNEALDRLNSPHRFVPALFEELLSDPAEDPDRPDAVEEVRIICSRRFIAWLNKDPEAATEWLLSLPTEAISTQKFISKWGICYQGDSGVGRSHAAEISALRKLPDSPARNAGLESHIRAWVRQDLVGSLAWVRATGDQELIGLAYQGAILAAASEAPDQALALYSALPDGPAKPTVAMELAAAWAGTDPEAAIHWLDGAQPGWPQTALEQPEPVRTPLANWAATRPADYLAWLAAHARDEVQRLKNVLLISAHLKLYKKTAEMAELQAAYRARTPWAELHPAALAWLKTAQDQSAKNQITSRLVLSGLFSDAEKSQLLFDALRPEQ